MDCCLTWCFHIHMRYTPHTCSPIQQEAESLLAGLILKWPDPAAGRIHGEIKCVFVVRPGNWQPGLSGAENTLVWEGMWEYCILQLWSEARASAGLGCPGLWWVVFLAAGHKADITALLLHLPGQKLCDVILLPLGLKCRGIGALALRAACMCWRWKQRMLIRLKSWEVTRFIKARGAPISGNTRVLRLWWGTCPVTKHCTSRNAEACSREMHRPWPGGSLGLPPSAPIPCLVLISSNLSLHFDCPSPSDLCATTTPSTCSPGFTSSLKPLQL